MLKYKHYTLYLPFEIINNKSGKRIKSVMVGGTIGYYLEAKFYPTKKALSMFKAEDKYKCPF
jgi:hypothetical protein